jgi:ABC-type nitrate/sulfonate/bicarbonate transport system ATPase subunit
MAGDKVLSVQHLCKQYASNRVIDDLSFEIGWNERVALFAPSGSGKTTLINILAGLEKSDSGSFSLEESAPATIFQEPRLFPFLTVEENIFLPFKLQGKAITPAVRQNYKRWLEVCRLGAAVRQYPHQISGGMKQKAALIRGLLGEPRFAMMDEPFQSIDGNSKQAIIKHILQSNRQTAFLFVTHQAEEIPQMAQRVLYFQSSNLKQVVEMDAADFQPNQPNLAVFINHRKEMCTAKYPSMI